MTTRRSYIPQHHGLSIEIVDYQIELAIAIEIADCKTSSRPGVGECVSGRRSDALKLSLQVSKQQRLLRVTRSPLMRISRRINMSIHKKQIEPAVVVVIDKTRPPTQERDRHFTKARLKRYVGKIVIAVVVIKNV